MKDTIIIIVIGLILLYFFVPAFHAKAEPFVDDGTDKLMSFLDTPDENSTDIPDTSIYSVVGFPIDGGSEFNCHSENDCISYHPECSTSICVCLDDGTCARKII